jgi:tRNA A37 threonylcarbamoyladenosine synthetase subunit TsaC/SUA5/YrdC
MFDICIKRTDTVYGVCCNQSYQDVIRLFKLSLRQVNEGCVPRAGSASEVEEVMSKVLDSCRCPRGRAHERSEEQRRPLLSPTSEMLIADCFII